MVFFFIDYRWSRKLSVMLSSGCNFVIFIFSLYRVCNVEMCKFSLLIIVLFVMEDCCNQFYIFEMKENNELFCKVVVLFINMSL